MVEINLVLRVRRDPQGVCPKTTIKSHQPFLFCYLPKAVEKSFVLQCAIRSPRLTLKSGLDKVKG